MFYVERAPRLWETNASVAPPGAAFAEPLAALNLDWGLELSPIQLGQLEAHCATLAQFTPRLNLTSLTDPTAIVAELVADSVLALRLEEKLRGTQVLDIGSGGGFPGLPLAIARPIWSVELLERKSSVALYLEEAVRRARVLNTTVLNIGLEEYRWPEERMVCLAKAVFHVEQYCKLLEACAPKSIQALWWGSPALDPDTLPPGWRIEAAVTAELPDQRRTSAVYCLTRE